MEERTMNKEQYTSDDEYLYLCLALKEQCWPLTQENYPVVVDSLAKLKVLVESAAQAWYWNALYHKFFTNAPTLYQIFD